MTVGYGFNATMTARPGMGDRLVELHVWAGGFHGFDALFPRAALSASARRVRSDWLGRILTPVPATAP
jgi:hypothetical protein